MDEGVAGLLRDKTRPPGKTPLAAAVINQVPTQDRDGKPSRRNTLERAGDGPIMVDLLHGARERMGHRRDFGQGADTAEPGSKPCALEVPRHLIAHDGSLLADFFSQRVIGAAGGFVHHH